MPLPADAAVLRSDCRLPSPRRNCPLLGLVVPPGMVPLAVFGVEPPPHGLPQKLKIPQKRGRYYIDAPQESLCRTNHKTWASSYRPGPRHWYRLAAFASKSPHVLFGIETSLLRLACNSETRRVGWYTTRHILRDATRTRKYTLCGSTRMGSARCSPVLISFISLVGSGLLCFVSA